MLDTIYDHVRLTPKNNRNDLAQETDLSFIHPLWYGVQGSRAMVLDKLLLLLSGIGTLLSPNLKLAARSSSCDSACEAAA